MYGEQGSQATVANALRTFHGKVSPTCQGQAKSRYPEKDMIILKGREWTEVCVYGGNIIRTRAAETASARLEMVRSDGEC